MNNLSITKNATLRTSKVGLRNSDSSRVNNVEFCFSLEKCGLGSRLIIGKFEKRIGKHSPGSIKRKVTHLSIRQSIDESNNIERERKVKSC